MSERCCQLGEGGQLAGILTEPHAAGRRIGLVLVSAGLLPKCGPFRLYAELARRLAHEGVVTLRFDLGGIGDSGQAHASVPLKERTALELKDAIDYLTSHYDLEHVVIGGLCSGAEDAFRYAENDDRVGGVMMIDPFAYRTPGWVWRHAAHRLTRRSLRVLGLYEPTVRTSVASAGAPSKRLVSYTYMARAESRRILGSLLARKARAHFVYTGGMREVFNHKQQLADMFPTLNFNGLVSVNYFPNMEHTQVLAADREVLVGAIARWFQAFRS